MLIERVLIRPLYKRSVDDPLLLTFGLGYVLVEAVRIVFGSDGIPFSTPSQLAGVVDLGIGYFPIYRLFVIGVVAVILLLLWLGLERTKFGLIVRAGARDPLIMRVLGVEYRQGLAIGLRARRRVNGARRRARRADAQRQSRDGLARAGGSLRRHRDRRHGLACWRGCGRPARWHRR